jgi:hypothetical protein
MNIPADDIRQAAFASTWDEWHERHGGRFYRAWHFDSDPALIRQFWSDLASRLSNRSIDEIGADLSRTEQPDWNERERGAWIAVLGEDAFRPLADENRDRLVGRAAIAGRLGQARRLGVRL